MSERIRLQIGHPIADLPNVAGFKFRGVLENGDLVPCITLRDDRSLHYAASDPDGARMYGSLRGWMQYLPTKATP